MSIKTIAWAWEITTPQLGPLDQLVLLALADHADDGGGNCFPSVKTLARKTRLSPRTVKRRLHRLEELGLIAITPRVREDGSASSNTYRLIITRGATETPPGVSQPPGDDTVDTGPTAGGTRGWGPGDTPYNPSVNPSFKPPRKAPSGNGNGPLVGFDRFWEAYPRKIAKKAAEKAWNSLNPPPNLVERIVGDVEARSQSDPQWAREGGQYVPSPARYLSGERWTDRTATSTAAEYSPC